MSRVALVTGGTRGIGLAMVRALREDGVKVAVAGHGPTAPLGCDMYIRVDLADDLDRRHIADAVHNNLGGLDILVNNAGAQGLGMLQSFELMVAAAYDLSQQATKYMRANGGHIVNILSTAAFQGARNITPYVVAKHALLGLTRALAVEWAPDIHVNAIAPGLTNTDMTKDMPPERRTLLESITPAGRFCEPEEIAAALMFLVNSTGIYGQVITVDNGWMVKNGG